MKPKDFFLNIKIAVSQMFHQALPDLKIQLLAKKAMLVGFARKTKEKFARTIKTQFARKIQVKPAIKPKVKLPIIRSQLESKRGRRKEKDLYMILIQLETR